MKNIFIESIPYEQVNPSQKRSNNFKDPHDNPHENKLTRFQIYQETEFACKYTNPLYKTQYSEILVECDKGFDMTTGKVNFDPYATIWVKLTQLTPTYSPNIVILFINNFPKKQ